MRRIARGWSPSRLVVAVFSLLVCGGLVAAFTVIPSEARHPAAATAAEQVSFVPDQLSRQEQILRGRHLALEHACGGACHGPFEGGDNPAAEGWLAGLRHPAQEFKIGPCVFEPGATPCFRTRPRNLTPDNLTGIGRFSERQIFNALRYGLRPGETPDVEITSTTPGQGNFPANPKYLAPPMPWPAWRHMPDEDLWAIAAYLKHGLEPVRNRVADSEGPPDFWASTYTAEAMGTYPPPPFPSAKEVVPAESVARRDVLLRGRQEVLEHGCGDCHGGWVNPAAEGWLAGVTSPSQEFPVGPCAVDATAQPCFRMRPRNLTPDSATGLGRYSERQIFNAIRFGLRPASTPDIEITSTVAGQGNHPANPDYLGPGMPWTALRHMADEDIRAIVAYLRYGVKPVRNEVPDSDRPPDLWASHYTVEMVGPYPAPPFPTATEVAPAPRPGARP